MLVEVDDNHVEFITQWVKDIEMINLFLDQVGVPPGKTTLDRVRDFYYCCNGVLNAMREWFGEMPHIIDPREHPFLAGWEAMAVLAEQLTTLTITNPMLKHNTFKAWAAKEDEERKGTQRETVDEALARIKGEQKNRT